MPQTELRRSDSLHHTLYGDELGSVLHELLKHDTVNAALSPSFRLFYRLRPFVPMFARQLLQRVRNRNRPLDTDWFLPKMLTDRLKFFAGRPSIHWPNDAKFAFVLTHDIETIEGMRRIPEIAAIEEDLGFRSSWNVVPYKYKIDRGLVQDLLARGHEIGIHGYNHDGRLFLSKRIFDRRVRWINQAMADYGAVGFRAPMVHRNVGWLQQLDIQYDASCFDIDPLQAMPGGVGSLWPLRVGKFIELPYTLPQDHTLFVTLGETTDRIWREKLAFIRQWHGMALMLTHPDYLASPQRQTIYRQFLAAVADGGGFWHALPREVARVANTASQRT